MSTFLLDTHVLLWWFTDSDRLSTRARSLLSDEQNIFLASAASAWEIATKARLGRLPGLPTVTRDYELLVARNGFQALEITQGHALRAGSFDHAHRDPFDRMLAAQSMIEVVPILTIDPAVAALGARTVW